MTILGHIEKMEPQAILNFLKKTVASGKIRRSSAGDVIRQIETLLREKA